MRNRRKQTSSKTEYKQYCQDNNIKWNPAKTVGIHSIGTAEAYRQTINEFGDWLKDNHKEVDNLNK